MNFLLKLKDRLDNALKSNFPNGAFIKLNTRSPKDVTIYNFKVIFGNHGNHLGPPTERKNSKSYRGRSQ